MAGGCGSVSEGSGRNNVAEESGEGLGGGGGRVVGHAHQEDAADGGRPLEGQDVDAGVGRPRGGHLRPREYTR